MFPAPAGMSPPRHTAGASHTHVPRTCGDEPDPEVRPPVCRSASAAESRRKQQRAHQQNHQLFGSLVQDRQTPDSDIDLVAIFDDLDYTTRWSRKAELQRLASEAAERYVDVRVTDWPEWKIRSRVVTTSFESSIARDAIVLWESEPRGVDWDKEIGLPATNHDEAVASLHNACDALTNLGTNLQPGLYEQIALSDADPGEYVSLLSTRIRMVCSQAQAALENSLKAFVHQRGGQAPPRTHQIAELIEALSPDDQREVASCLSDLVPADASLWRQQGTDPADFPEVPLPELVPLAYRMATAAARLARIAADVVDSSDERSGPTAALTDAAARGATRSRTAAERTRSYAGRILDVLAQWDLAAPTPTATMGRPPPPQPCEPGPQHI